jgi:hypothetical protein
MCRALKKSTIDAMPSPPDLLQSTGFACVIFAIVGGGLTVFGIKVPIISSVKRQVLLGIFGVILLVVPYTPPAILSLLHIPALGIGPQGHIDLFDDTPVPRRFDCTGSATGIPEGKHLWLVEEDSQHNMWPKDALGPDGIVPDGKGRWRNWFEENGYPGTFSISLVVADSAASANIRKWLEDGKAKGKFDALRGLPGATTITSVTGLTLR